MRDLHVFVTGASSGIGESLAREALRRGARVTIVARRQERLAAIAQDAPDRVHVIAADLADIAGIPAVVASATAAFGSIDVLINNAGVQIVAAATDSTWAEADALLRIDVHAPLRLTHTILPAMIAHGSGTIVDIASMAALAPTPGMYFYNAAKGALAAASEGLRAEVAPHGVHVVTVYPGPVASDMEAAAREAYVASPAMSRLPTGKPDELAALVFDAIAKKHPRVIYPKAYALSRYFPSITRRLLDRFSPALKDRAND